MIRESTCPRSPSKNMRCSRKPGTSLDSISLPRFPSGPPNPDRWLLADWGRALARGEDRVIRG
jgi:hypothetical protein